MVRHFLADDDLTPSATVLDPEMAVHASAALTAGTATSAPSTPQAAHSVAVAQPISNDRKTKAIRPPMTCRPWTPVVR